jgi:hypothetical protein
MSFERPVFIQNAKGQFAVNVSGDTHCGPDHTSPKIFDYEVSIKYTHDKELDTNGFLLDNLSFHNYFMGLGNVDISCEKLVQKCWLYFADHAPLAHNVKVCVWAIAGKACVSFEGSPVFRDEVAREFGGLR